MAKFIRTPSYPDSMPVDISFVFESERPAGKHGFLKADGDDFRFEDGTLARFWGVNINGASCFPEHDYAEKFADRLAQTGLNIVRFHQIDAQWAPRNIYTFSRGKRITTTRVLDERSLERMDYLVKCLKDRGIYVYFDMVSYRKFKSGDGVVFPKELHDGAAPYASFDRRLINLQKEFCTQIWTHVNPYTGLAYKDEPAIAMMEIVNENEPFSRRCDRTEGEPTHHYPDEVRALFRDWLKEKGIEYDWENCDLHARVQPLLDFKIEKTMAFYREMTEHIRSLGVKIPITGTNWSPMPAIVACQGEMDFTDSHQYFKKDWTWNEHTKTMGHAHPIGEPFIFERAAVMRQHNKPFFISEWDSDWPNSFRAEGPLYYAAISALQGWSGATIHTYSYSTRLSENMPLGKEMSPETLNGITYRTGLFTTWNDTALYGLFYHCALILRRGDISPAKEKIGVPLPALDKHVLNAHSTGLDVHRMTTLLPGVDPAGCDRVMDAKEAVPWETPTFVRSDNGQIWRDTAKVIAGIDTPRTQAIYGILAKNGANRMDPVPGLECSSLKVRSKTDYAVIVLSSLTDEPIEKSDNMLLSTIGRVRNTGAQFDGNMLVENGTAPVLSELVEAEIAVRTERDDLQVWGISPEGYYTGRIDAVLEDGWLKFTLGECCGATYYLIIAE